MGPRLYSSFCIESFLECAPATKGYMHLLGQHKYMDALVLVKAPGMLFAALLHFVADGNKDVIGPEMYALHVAVYGTTTRRGFGEGMNGPDIVVKSRRLQVKSAVVTGSQQLTHPQPAVFLGGYGHPSIFIHGDRRVVAKSR